MTGIKPRRFDVHIGGTKGAKWGVFNNENAMAFWMQNVIAFRRKKDAIAFISGEKLEHYHNLTIGDVDWNQEHGTVIADPDPKAAQKRLSKISKWKTG